MTAVDAPHGRCPECGVAIPITAKVGTVTHTVDGLVMEVEPDLTDVTVHAWTHEQE